MKKLHSFQHYFDLLLATYKLFFKAARSLAAFVFCWLLSKQLHPFLQSMRDKMLLTMFLITKILLLV